MSTRRVRDNVRSGLPDEHVAVVINDPHQKRLADPTPVVSDQQQARIDSRKGGTGPTGQSTVVEQDTACPHARH